MEDCRMKASEKVNRNWLWSTGGGWQGMSVSVTAEKAKHQGKDIARFIDFIVGRQRISYLGKNGGICM